MARFAVNNSLDHSATLWIVTFLLLSYTTLTTMMRGVLKFGMMGADDAMAGLAQLFVYGNIFSIIYGLRHGLAQSDNDSESSADGSKFSEVSDQWPLSSVVALSVVALRLTKSGTPGKRYILPPVTGRSQGRHDIIFEKSLPAIELYTYHSTLQNRSGSCGWLGVGIGGSFVHRLRCETLVRLAKWHRMHWEGKFSAAGYFSLHANEGHRLHG